MSDPSFDFREQPRCENCGHRRIFHFVRRRVAKRGPGVDEVMTVCRVDTDNPERKACGCIHYKPIQGRMSA